MKEILAIGAGVKDIAQTTRKIMKKRPLQAAVIVKSNPEIFKKSGCLDKKALLGAITDEFTANGKKAVLDTITEEDVTKLGFEKDITLDLFLSCCINGGFPNAEKFLPKQLRAAQKACHSNEIFPTLDAYKGFIDEQFIPYFKQLGKGKIGMMKKISQKGIEQFTKISKKITRSPLE